MQQPSGVVQPGDVIAGKYRVEELVGQGGFGAVFRAKHLALDRPVALKMLLPQALASADGLARFRREAELAQHLEHPNTVRLYDFGETESGAPFIAWEFLKGRSLDALIRDEGAISVSRVAHIGSQTLKSLMEAHGRGIIHRDIKPSNLFLCEFSGERDFVKVLDFGIAKSTQGQAMTLGGTLLGTPAYMSPEQVAGKEVTPASDVYSLGLVMAEAISGHPVYEGESGLNVAMRQLSDDPAPLSQLAVTSAIGPIVVRATHKDVARRYASAAEMLEALECVDAAWLRSSDSKNGPVVITPPRPVQFEDTARTPPPPAPTPFPELSPAAFTSSLPEVQLSGSASQTGAPTPGGVAHDRATEALDRKARPSKPNSEVPTSPSPGTINAASSIPLKVLAAIAGAAVLVIGVPAVLIVVLSSSGPSGPGTSTARARSTEDAPTDTRAARPIAHWSTLPPRHFRDKLVHAGYKVITETSTESVGQTTWMVQLGQQNGSVMHWRTSDAQTAAMDEAGLNGAEHTAAVRDGNTLLVVMGFPNGHKLAEQLIR